MLGQEAHDESSEKLKQQSHGDKRLKKRSPSRQHKTVRFAHAGNAPVDVVIWRNRYISGAVLAGAAMLWLLFQRIGYSSITFICHSLMLSLVALFSWSNYCFFVNKTTFVFPLIVLPEDLCTRIALTLTHTCNQAISIFRQVALGKDTGSFLSVVMVLWLVSIVDFFTVIYMLTVVIMVMPLLHEKNREDQVDSYAQKAKTRITKQYSTLDERVLQRLSKVPFIADNTQPQQQQEEEQEHQEQQMQLPQQEQL